MLNFRVNDKIYPRAESIKAYVNESEIYVNSNIPESFDLSFLTSIPTSEAFGVIHSVGYKDLHPVTLLMVYHLADNLFLPEKYQEFDGYEELRAMQVKFAEVDSAMQLLEGGRGHPIPDEFIPSTLSPTLDVLNTLSEESRLPEDVVFTDEYSVACELGLDTVVVHLLRHHRLGKGPYSFETLCATDLYLRLGAELSSLVKKVFDRAPATAPASG